MANMSIILLKKSKNFAKYLLCVSCDIVDFMTGSLFHLCLLNLRPIGIYILCINPSFFNHWLM